MMILLLIVSIIAAFITCAFIDDELIFIPVIGFFVKLGVIVILCIQLIGIKVIDEKIELYQNQNNEIESKIEIVVKQYMEHEHKTLEALNNDNSYITLVTLYPELKSDKLIEEEINVYLENNEKILELKNQKINEKIYKWWLYFG